MQIVDLTSGQSGKRLGYDLNTEGRSLLPHVRIGSVESEELGVFQRDLATLMSLLEPDSLVIDLRSQLGLSSPFFLQDLFSLVSVSRLDDTKPVQFIDGDSIFLNTSFITEKAVNRNFQFGSLVKS